MKDYQQKRRQFIRVVGKYWNKQKQKLQNFQFCFDFTKNNEIEQTGFHGQILRRDYLKGICQQPEILTNYEQIKDLEGFGQYSKGIRGKVNGKLIWMDKSFSKFKVIIEGDEKTQNILKRNEIRLLERMLENFCNKVNCKELGAYKNDQSVGKQIYVYTIIIQIIKRRRFLQSLTLKKRKMDLIER
ncbi:unnamed protein product [Paramecium sonneborni]|uniref:Uncharacterized protein n=1 Tax=Paramecium sonneborni TaxID=65129 RepID=A0A8S1QYW4_9CILI|nr:unnamed protein product [Paramecium sonneborni]